MSLRQWRRGDAQRRLRENGGEGIVGAAGSGVFVATSRIVAEYPELQFW